MFLDPLLLPWIVVLEEWVTRMSRGAFPRDDDMTSFERVMRCVKQLAYMRGVFQVRKPTPRTLWGVTLVHLALSMFILLYPFVCPRAYDGFYFAFMVLLMLGWLVFKGECFISLFEKKLYYANYRMGDAPIHQWWSEALPIEHVLLVGWFFVVGWSVSLLLTTLRNVSLHSDGVGFSVRFGGARSLGLDLRVHAST
jgi:hypothetical protein